MSSKFRVRPWSYPLLMLALVLSVLGVTPAAQADDNPRHYVSLTYNCLQGQTVALTPGQMRSQIVDENGTVIGQGVFSNASLTVYPGETIENDRFQYENGSSQTSFHPELGLPLNSAKTLRLEYDSQDTGNHIDYDQSVWTCEGEPTDTDGDTVPDELDDCPTVAGTGSNGCAPAGVINVISVQPAHGTSNGVITLSVTNSADSTATAVTYQLNRDGELLHTTPVLEDGQTSPAFTVSSAAGTRTYCISGDDGSYNCVDINVPADSTPAYSGKLTFAQTCTGLRTTVTNDGWKSPTFEIRTRSMHGLTMDVVTRRLAPGESLTLFTGRHYHATSEVRLWSTEDGHQAALGGARWNVPSDCTPMIGGTKLIKWGKIRANGIPRAIVRTKAYRAQIGVQWKRGIKPAWDHIVKPGRHKVALFKVPRHGKRCFRLWVQYFDGTDFYGERVFTRWHCYRRR